MTYTHQEHVHATRKWLSDDALPRPGFKSTAVYFEWLAQKERRDDERRQRLLEVARFYRSLAGIIPAMPTRCKINDVGLSLHARSAGAPALRNAECWPIALPIQPVANNWGNLRKALIRWPWRLNEPPGSRTQSPCPSRRCW